MNKYGWMAAALLTLCLAAPAPAEDFRRVGQEVAADLRQAQAEKTATQAAQEQRLAQLRADLERTQAELEQEKRTQAALQERLAGLSQEKAIAEAELREVSGDLQEMAGHVRAAARELLGLAQTSPVTAEMPQRLDILEGMLAKGRLPGMAELENLIRLYREEVRAAGRRERRQGNLVDQAGREVPGEILRLGAFTTLYRQGDQVGFLLPGPNPTRLLAVDGHLSWGMETALDDFLSGASRAVPLDISGGAALRGLSRDPSWGEQLQAGGPLVWPILAVGALALVLLLERLWFLGRVRGNTDALLGRVIDLLDRGRADEARQAAQAQAGRPVPNLILAGLELAGRPAEVVEAGLGEAMLRQMPRLERSLVVLKVLAAVAPLLGLLGTVTGMINTFRVITVHGSGDPRLMAGGISEALITTELGLAVAIPILVAATLLGRWVKRVAGDLEEKALRLCVSLVQAGGRP